LTRAQASKLYGIGPASFVPPDASHLYKFSSATKEFQHLSAVTFSMSVDAVTLAKRK
jgi:alkyl hydroperoxide reductase subunit AhpC